VGDPQRLEELRRRVERDPASLAFAQLAEECRRAGQFQEAVRVSREGLAHHPDYLSARVTLGRALIGLEHLDQAAAELSGVLRTAPENLAALRGLAEIQQRRGFTDEALEYYSAALALAPRDPEILAALETLHHAELTPGAADGHGPIVAAAVGRAELASSSPETGTPAPGSSAMAPREPAATRGVSPALPRLERWLAVLDARRTQAGSGGRG
jgi:tetratricopeptide (TPR) repeat protein